MHGVRQMVPVVVWRDSGSCACDVDKLSLVCLRCGCAVLSVLLRSSADGRARWWRGGALQIDLVLQWMRTVLLWREAEAAGQGSWVLCTPRAAADGSLVGRRDRCDVPRAAAGL